ncbi:MAG: NHL repeat-containing protein [Thermodesulfobacteriota bacterium]
MISKKSLYLLKNLYDLRNLWILFTILLFTTPAHSQEAKITYRVRHILSIDGKTSGSPFSSIQDIYVDKERGEIYVIEGGSNRRVVITNLKGTALYQFVYGDISPPPLIVDKKGDIYVTDTNRIGVLNYRGIYKRELDLSTIPDMENLVIQTITFDSDGRLYIGDSGKGRVIVLDRDKKFLFQFGGKGYGQGKFLNVQTINVYNNKIYLLDPALFRVSVFDKRGTFLFSFGRASSLLGGFAMPVDMAVDSKGRILVVDANRFQVIMFDGSSGRPLFEFGGPRVFYWPKTIELDKDGRIYVTDAKNTVRVFEIVEEQIP